MGRQHHLEHHAGHRGPLFVAGYLITRVDFTVVWRYFAWTNQTLATIVLWAVVVWLFATKRNYFVALLPAVFMTFICASFVFVSGQFFGMENRQPTLWQEPRPQSSFVSFC